MNQVIQAEQAINEVNQHLRLLGVQDEFGIQSSQEQDADFYYVEFNPFLMVVEQDANVDIFTNVNHPLHSARVLMGFNISTPDKTVWVSTFKTQTTMGSFQMGLSFNEFIAQLNKARPVLFAKIAEKFNNRKQTKSAQVSAPVAEPALKYSVYNLRDYTLNSAIMQIVPTDKGGAVLMANVTDGVVTFKYSVCSRDDKFSGKIGRQEAQKCKPFTVSVPKANNSYEQSIWIAMQQASQDEDTPSTFKQVIKLYRKMLNMRAN